ncbi:MAG: hypothetical protein DI538_02840 [Azospira oryzae]|nr:MAG: hypothetical protein DI538_02840 [Azospira oryzae]
MKQNFSYFLVFGVILTLGLLRSTTAYSQEEGIPGYDLHDPAHTGSNTDDKTLLLDSDTKSKIGKDSLAIITRPATPAKKPAEAGKPSTGKPKNDEDDPLSFNFLYYIIQKFKASDLIDQ